MVPEAKVERTDEGVVPKPDGWFVLNARDSRWYHAEGRSAFCDFEGDADFRELGMNIGVLGPGEAMAMYHWEADQEDFLVVAGEAVLVIEGEERPLRQWDFVHCPVGASHMIICAGDAPCVVVAVGARGNEGEGVWGVYPVADAAQRHGVGVDVETSDAEVAYEEFEAPVPASYRKGSLPGD